MVAPSISFSQTRATKFELYCREREREREIILLQQQHNITCNKPNYMGNRFSGGAKYTAGGKNLRFSTEIAVYLGNSARRGPLYFLVVLVCVCAWYAFILLQLDVADCTEGTYVHKMKNQKPKKNKFKKSSNATLRQTESSSGDHSVSASLWPISRSQLHITRKRMHVGSFRP